ncbi:unnamed protein product [Cuscuta europaea]|uniref:Uncharacterized protein n=1 Tax=Cuscuta europaea TaxID=41803 RepID=A0A9P0YIX5_CUSEU|nr:unnamed protein product [Cuscuta europaea]
MAGMHPHQEYTTSTAYLFLSYSNNVRHELMMKVTLCMPLIFVSDEQGLVVESPRLLVRLPLQNRPGMVCAKLGSKFYFLGGEKRDVLVGDNRILVGDKNVESNLEYENKVDDKKIGTNLC